MLGVGDPGNEIGRVDRPDASPVRAQTSLDGAQPDGQVAEDLPVRGITLLSDGALAELSADPVGGARLSRRVVPWAQRHQSADEPAEPDGIRARTAPGWPLAEDRLHHHDHQGGEGRADEHQEREDDLHFCFARTSSMALPNAGRSPGTREETMLPSITDGASTHSAPALTTSSRIPAVLVSRRPRTIPAEMRTHGPWQMVATIFPAWWISRTRRSASASRRILSGAQPPGATIPASEVAGKSATRPSTLHGYPCFPRYSRSPRPASLTSKPASSRRSFGYQTSRSSYSGPTSIRIAGTSFPSARSGVCDPRFAEARACPTRRS